MNDVLNIHDIPSITDYLDLEFYLSCFEIGDQVQIYHHRVNDECILNVVIHSDEKLINGIETLLSLITQDNIEYLCFSIWKSPQEQINSWYYRPLIDISQKQNIIG